MDRNEAAGDLTEAALQLCVFTLQHQQFPLQHLILALLSGYFKMQKRAFVID